MRYAAALALIGVLTACAAISEADPSTSPSDLASLDPSPSMTEGPVTTKPSPSPPPAEPITSSVEEQGIRLTVTLDRDRTTFGQRVMATATIENIGPDTVFWGHSGTCVYPASIQARPDDPDRLSYGRDDWPGENGILKSVTVDERIADFDPAFGFLPAEWLDFEGDFGCTSDLVLSELAAGESLVQQLGWDTLGYYGMPPPPGSYTVDATFYYMSRGAPPAGDLGIDQFAVDPTLPIVIDGRDIDYISPGEAVDALLADLAFQEHLADAPRSRWLQSDITFSDGRWETELLLTASATEVEPVEAIVATIDARSGRVLSVALEEHTPPPGG